jgi:hypothetical protein
MNKFIEKSKNLKIYSIMKRIKLEKLFALGIIFLLLISTFLIFIPKVESQNRFSGKGSGTPWDPYVITNVKQLQEMKYDLKAHYVLGNDIDASETKNWNNGQGFEPIGDFYNRFTGSFDGKGYKIYNLYINTTRAYVGLFGFVGKEGIVKNVGLENVKMSSTRWFIGGLVGLNEYGTVSNCYSTGTVKGGEYVGGLIGENYRGTISNCYSTVFVNGERIVGGLIGLNNGTVFNCYSTGSVNGGEDVGGLIGYSYGVVSNCYSTASVNGTEAVGGLVGINFNIISNCYSTGTVNGKLAVGGLVGINFNIISNCYSTASINGKQGVGGLVGINVGTVSNCYSTGTVKGGEYVGGLIGENYRGTISNCYSTVFVNGERIVGGLIGLNNGTVFNCYSTGSVNGGEDVGGLIGYSYGVVSNCYSTASVNGTEAVGGLVGINFNIISNCYSTGTVNGKLAVGGLVGINFNIISNCYSTASINGKQGVGGLVGINVGTVSNCYSTGTVKGGEYVGGLIGVNRKTVSNSFWDIETSGLKRSDGGTGKTTAEMKNVRTYTDVGWSKGLESPWDFVGNPYDDKGNEDIWDIKPNINNGYPYLTTIKTISTIEARRQLYENYAKALDPWYWNNKGNELLAMFEEDFIKSFTTPLGILKTIAKKLAQGKYSSAELIAKEVITIAGVTATWDISGVLGFTYSSVYESRITNPSEEMQKIFSLIKEGKIEDALNHIRDLLNYLKIARSKVDDPLVPAMYPVSKERVKKLFDSTISFLEGEQISLFQNGIEITLEEPGHKLYLHIYDNLGRHVGINYESGKIETEIPNCSYIDLDNAIIIMLPLNLTNFRILVDAKYATKPIENYSIMIQVYKEGNLVSSTSLSSQININTKKEYSLQLTGDLKPILNELTTTPSPSPTITSPTQTLTTSPSAAPLNIELIIIIIVIAAILASLVIVFRKYKAK